VIFGPSPRRAALVAVTELRRTRRSLGDSTRGVILLLGAGVLIPLYSLAIGAFAFGATSGGIETGPLADPATVRLATAGLLAGLGSFVGFFVLQRTIKTTGEPDAADGLLTTVPYADVLLGLLAAEWGRMAAVLAGPLFALALGVSAGSGLVGLGVAVLSTGLVAATLGLLLGYAGGLVAKLVVARSAFVARYRAVLGALTSLVFVVGYLALSGDSGVQRAALRAVTRSPLSWAVDIVLLMIPSADADPLAAAVAGTVLLGGLPASVAACLWLAERVWYVDPVQPAHEFDADEPTLSGRLLTGRVSTATRVVAQKSWLRARRAPLTVQFATGPFFLLAFQLQTVLLEGTVPPTLPLTAGLASALAAGAAFALNPLGGEERVLPLTLTADISGRAFLTGLSLAGILPGVVLATVLVVGVGFAAGTPPLALAAMGGTTVVATLAAPPIAAAAGLVFPKFERTSVKGREVVVPSALAFGLYAVAFGVVVGPGAIAVSLSLTDVFPVPLAHTTLLGGGVLATVLVGTVVAGLSFHYAATRIGGYRLE